MNKVLKQNKNLTLASLLTFINQDFYENITTKRELFKFSRLIIDAFCKERGLPSTILLSKDYGENALGFTHWGPCFDITINRRYFRIFDKMRENHNFSYLFRYFETLFHELRHHEQFFGALENESGILKNFVALYRHSVNLADFIDSHMAYYCNPTELDARNYSYIFLKQIPLFERFLNSESFKQEEIDYETDDEFDMIGLIKSKEALKMARVNKFLKNIDKEVSQIAIKHNLRYVGENKLDEKTATELNNLISAEFAPAFYNPTFICSENDPQIDKLVEEEMDAFETEFSKSIPKKTNSKYRLLKTEKIINIGLNNDDNLSNE